ncbi:MAG: primosomal protein N' [Oscillospiraceae bacterium]|nr:primosomal protein N' [Oscillospiraceae bacterium]
MSPSVAKIAVSAATYWIDKPYDYLIPENLADMVKPGVRVSVPFARGNRRAEGLVLAVSDRSEQDKLKAILTVLDEAPILSAEQIKLALFMRERFFCTVYEAVKAILPAGLWFNETGERRAKDKTIEMARLRMAAEEAATIAQNKRRSAPQQAALLELLSSFETLPVRDLLTHTGASRQSFKALQTQELVETFEREVFRRPETFQGDPAPLPVLNGEQQAAFEGLQALADSGKASCALLFGVTGSGKTSVYIHLIQRQLSRGRSAILLVPEIALTPQMLHTFSSHFGDEIAVLHSSLSVGERYDEWKRIRSGKAHVVIGTRSAVFAPVNELGIVIIDEEQEESYKSENSPRYHARDVAKYLCARAGALLVLGSATPDVESRYYAETGRYAFFALHERYNDMALPEVRIVDMKRELRRGNSGDISETLREELESNLSRGEQSILFINRRGAHKLISCVDCGYTYKCPNCSVSLTYHSANKRLMCHYCGFSRRVDPVCPDCGGELKYLGTGTQRVVEELNQIFPETEILRVDTDSVSPLGSHEPLFERFRTEKIPIMVGTQMVTKGLNFDNVTLVGVLAADQSLYSGDYRAGERTFSLITQVVGRSGRGEKPGRAIIQTFTPNNQTIRQAAAQDYDAFYASEIELRRLQNAPPLCQMFSLTASGQNEEQVLTAVRILRKLLEASVRDIPDTAILGPAPLPVVKVNNRYRYRINITCQEAGKLRKILSQTIITAGQDKRFRGVSVFADNEPSA